MKTYGLSLAKSFAVLVAVVGAVAAAIGLGFMTCMDVEERVPNPFSLWEADYCSGALGVFLVITTTELLYLGVLTEFRIIPRFVGFVSIGMMGAIASAYLVGIVAASG
ncbi:MAG: hypothetical protein SFY66_18605 [Oculatellaceae cyanobacterium bins.114]|nr:hypothetical protein [Oculatellaceae cyanobacterium bins.114]